MAHGGEVTIKFHLGYLAVFYKPSVSDLPSDSREGSEGKFERNSLVLYFVLKNVLSHVQSAVKLC